MKDRPADWLTRPEGRCPAVSRKRISTPPSRYKSPPVHESIFWRRWVLEYQGTNTFVLSLAHWARRGRSPSQAQIVKLRKIRDRGR